MSITINTITNVDVTHNQICIDGTLTVSGSYTTGGVTLSFAGMDQVKSSLPPTKVEVYEQPAPGTAVSGNTWYFVPGTSQANGSVQLFTGATQFAAGAFPSVVLKFRAWFPKV